VLLLTIGHSNRPIESFLEMLKAHGVELLVDVRTMPRSRYNPQFNRETLPASLAAAGIDYRHTPELGGLRHPRKDSINTGWRNLSFRGYADYMQTPEFEANIEDLLGEAARRRTAVMCAESVPWRCHRSLIADAATVRGVPVRHIMSATKADPHKLTPFARAEGTRLTYPPDELTLF
jgi:uncharacterized protein (DUF488 family)